MQRKTACPGCFKSLAPISFENRSKVIRKLKHPVLLLQANIRSILIQNICLIAVMREVVMTHEQSARIEALLAVLQSKWGANALQLASEVTRLERNGIPTGFAALDQTLGKVGIPRGALTELWGKPTSGMTTLTYHILAQAQGVNAFSIYVDLHGTFDPEYAVCCGLRLERLLIVRPDTDLQALDMTYDLLSRSLGAIALDFGKVIPQSSLLRRLSSSLSRSDCALLILIGLDAQSAVTNGTTALRLAIERTAWLREQNGTGLRGYRAAVTVLKSRHPLESRRIEIEIINEDCS
jgi:hypothetical protein